MHYLGSLKETRDPPNPKYVDYARSNPMPRQSFRPGRREEFAACLNRVGVGIDSDDVQGIRKVVLNWLNWLHVRAYPLMLDVFVFFSSLSLHTFAKKSNQVLTAG